MNTYIHLQFSTLGKGTIMQEVYSTKYETTTNNITSNLFF
jgi:hypothetical protein